MENTVKLPIASEPEESKEKFKIREDFKITRNHEEVFVKLLVLVKQFPGFEEWCVYVKNCHQYELSSEDNSKFDELYSKTRGLIHQMENDFTCFNNTEDFIFIKDYFVYIRTKVLPYLLGVEESIVLYDQYISDKSNLPGYFSEMLGVLKKAHKHGMSIKSIYNTSVNRHLHTHKLGGLSDDRPYFHGLTLPRLKNGEGAPRKQQQITMLLDKSGYVEEVKDPVDDKTIFDIRLFISKNFKTQKSVNRKSNSYGIKHYIENRIGRYVTNGETIKAMIDEGFTVSKPKTEIGPNCFFNVKLPNDYFGPKK